MKKQLDHTVLFGMRQKTFFLIGEDAGLKTDEKGFKQAIPLGSVAV